MGEIYVSTFVCNLQFYLYQVFVFGSLKRNKIIEVNIVQRTLKQNN